MAKRKLVPEYEFAISKDANIQKGVISNIFAGLKESDKRFFKGISDLKLSNSNNGAITLADVARNFIRKNSDDVVDGELSFTKGIKSDNYDNGLDGIGYKLYKDEFGKGNLEIDKLTVREHLFTKLLTYEKINAIGGTLILSAAWCEVTRSELIEAVDPTDYKIKCYYIPDGVSAQMWMVGDQIRLQSSADRFLMTYVTDVSTSANSDGEFMIELYYGNEEDSQQQGATIPQQGDTLVQWGYRGIESHPERQNIIIISSGNSDVTYPYIEQYEGIDDFSLTGKLISRISHDVYFGNADKTKYLWWNKDDNGEFLIKGTLTQSPSDETFPSTVYRGEFLDATQYYVGDIVTFNGSTYICIYDAYDEQPSDPFYWRLYASAGTDGTDGVDGVNGKMLSISGSSQVFKIDKFIVGTPEYISISAVGSNLTGTPTFSISDGTATLTAETTVSKRLYLTNMSTDKATIKVVWDGFTDYYTIYKIREGVDALNGILSNEAATVTANNDGSSPVLTGTSTLINAYYGISALEYEQGIGFPSIDGKFRVTYLASSGITPELASGDLAVVDDFTVDSEGLYSMTVDNGYIDYSINARINGENIAVVKRQSFSKAKKGANGEDGVDGSVGQAVRYSKWILGNTYFAGNINDGGTNNNPNRYIDYVTNLGTDGIVRAYKCESYHVATPANEPKTAGSSAEWSPISYLPALASDLLLAKQAVIGGFVFSEAIDASGNQISPSAQYMRTTDDVDLPAIRLNGDGTGHLAKGNFMWNAIGEMLFAKYGSNETIEITNGNIPSLADVENKELHVVDDYYNDSNFKYFDNPADSPWTPSESRQYEMDIENEARLIVSISLEAQATPSVTGLGLDALARIDKFIAGEWVEVSAGVPVSSTQYVLDVDANVSAGKYRVVITGVCGGTPTEGGSTIALNFLSYCEYQLKVKKLVIGIDGIALYDTEDDRYMRVSMQDKTIQMRLRMDTQIIDAGGTYGLRISSAGVEKTSNGGGTWTAI